MKNINTIFSAFALAGLLSLAPLQASEDSHNMEGMDHDMMGESKVGKSGKGMAVTKTYQVSLLDTMRFEFDNQPDLKDGDVVKFVVTNKGKIPHEFSIGSAAEQAAHREMMKSMPGMKHESDNTVMVQPGATVPLFWQFAGQEPVLFACNVAGHFEAGMKHSSAIN